MPAVAVESKKQNKLVKIDAKMKMVRKHPNISNIQKKNIIFQPRQNPRRNENTRDYRTDDSSAEDAPVAADVLVHEPRVVVRREIVGVAVLVYWKGVGRSINVGAVLREFCLDLILTTLALEPPPPIVIATPVYGGVMAKRAQAIGSGACACACAWRGN